MAKRKSLKGQKDKNTDLQNIAQKTKEENTSIHYIIGI
jgi:hypothetical protein